MQAENEKLIFESRLYNFLVSVLEQKPDNRLDLEDSISVKQIWALHDLPAGSDWPMGGLR